MPAAAMPVSSESRVGPGSSRLGSPRNLLRTNAGQPLAGHVGHERPRAVEVGERPAAVDVADEQRGGVGVLEHAVVDEVGEVDLRRAAGTFDHDEVVFGAQAVEGVLHRRPEEPAAVAPRHLGQVAPDDAVDHHLAAGVGLRLEQDRVHPHLRMDPGRAGLQPLGHADLAAVDDPRVVRHVLRLERRNVDALAGEPAAQRGHQQALARVRRAPEHHQRSHAGPPRPRSGRTSSIPAGCTPPRRRTTTSSAPSSDSTEPTHSGLTHPAGGSRRAGPRSTSARRSVRCRRRT